jgi:hypothetical protein
MAGRAGVLARQNWVLWFCNRGCDIDTFWKKQDGIINLILIKNGSAALFNLNNGCHSISSLLTDMQKYVFISVDSFLYLYTIPLAVTINNPLHFN